MSEDKPVAEDTHDLFSKHFSEQLGEPVFCVRYLLVADCVVNGAARAVLMNHSEEMPGWMVRGLLQEAREFTRDFEDFHDEIDVDADDE